MIPTDVVTATHEDATVLTPRQQRELLRMPDKRTRLGKRDSALLAVLMGSGCRIGEAVRLRVQDVQQGPNGALLLRVPTLKQRRKNGLAPLRAVALFSPFVTPIRKYLSVTNPAYWLFEGRYGEHLSVRAAQNAVKRYIRRVRPVGFRVHDLRHVAATDTLTGSGGDVWITAKMLGHVDTRQVVRTYAHYLTKDAIRAAEARAMALTRKGP
jgi:integrase/recombinase XerD